MVPLFRHVAERLRMPTRLCLLAWPALLVCAGIELGAEAPSGARQTQPWRVASFLEDAGLQGRGIFFLDFEADGTLWIAASDGLYRYDGYRWDRYTSEHGLPSDYVRCVRVVRDGRVWVGTDRGAGVFDGRTFDSRGSEAGLAGPSVRRIVEGPDGSLWFACDQWPVSNVKAGLTRYRDGAWKSWREADGLPSDYVSDIFIDREEHVWVLTRGGLARIEGDRVERPLERAGLAQCRDYVWSMVETPAGELIAATMDSICVRSGGRWRAFPHGPPKVSVPQLALTRDGAVLACTAARSGVFLEWKDNRLQPLWTAPLDTRGTVQSLREAPDGSIWLAGTNLLARWERLGGEWRCYEDLPPPQLRDEEGGVWFAGPPGRVLRHHDGRWTPFPGASAPVVGDSRGGVWMRTADGLSRWSAGGLARFTRQEMGIGAPRDLRVDGAGNLWVLSGEPDRGERLARFDGVSWASLPTTEIRPTESIITGTPDPRWGMWYVVNDSASDSFRLLRTQGRELVEVPLPDAARRYELPRVQTDRAGRLWLFGFLGLYRLDLNARGAEWERIDTLPGKQVLNVVERGEEVWFSYLGATGGRGGVTRLRGGVWDHFTSAARDLTAGDGNDALFFTHPRGVFIAPRGSTESPRLLALPQPTSVDSIVSGVGRELWIGSDTRVFHHTPDGVSPETVIVDGEKEVRFGDDLTLRLRGVERFKPLDRQGDFSVSFKLDDARWSEFEPLTDEATSVSVRNSGEHTIQVRLRDQGLDVDPTPAVWDFRVLSIPLEDRAWFRPLVVGAVLTVLLLAAFSVAAYRRDLAQRKRKQELEHEILDISEREQRRIGQDLHDGLGQRLTSISFQCEALRGMLEAKDAHAARRAKEIGTAVRTAISETRVLSHALYPAEVDSGDLELALNHLVRSVERGFDGTCTYRHRGGVTGLSRETVLNLYRLVQEALGNAIRHSRATTLSVESRRDGGGWVVDVRDDGCGFDPRRPRGRGLGLQIMRYRADLIGARLSVVSRPGSGTTIRCTVQPPDGKS